eukprot:GILI01014667.1.p1 GENE.GILI01014667.1~~GILI01014667.1.p1  ORF type:complete len:658 (+),score=99.54 GILI01014667.1:219-1976(+)
MLFICSYVLHVFERVSDSADNDPLLVGRHKTFVNSIWMLIITMLTVGYGDVYPITIPGRLSAIVCGFGGMMVSAILISVVHQSMVVTPKESKVIGFLSAHHQYFQLRNLAVSSIQTAWKMYKLKLQHTRQAKTKLRSNQRRPTDTIGLLAGGSEHGSACSTPNQPASTKPLFHTELAAFPPSGQNSNSSSPFVKPPDSLSSMINSPEGLSESRRNPSKVFPVANATQFRRQSSRTLSSLSQSSVENNWTAPAPAIDQATYLRRRKVLERKLYKVVGQWRIARKQDNGGDEAMFEMNKLLEQVQLMAQRQDHLSNMLEDMNVVKMFHGSRVGSQVASAAGSAPATSRVDSLPKAPTALTSPPSMALIDTVSPSGVGVFDPRLLSSMSELDLFPMPLRAPAGPPPPLPVSRFGEQPSMKSGISHGHSPPKSNSVITTSKTEFSLSEPAVDRHRFFSDDASVKQPSAGGNIPVSPDGLLFSASSSSPSASATIPFSMAQEKKLAQITSGLASLHSLLNSHIQSTMNRLDKLEKAVSYAGPSFSSHPHSSSVTPRASFPLNSAPSVSTNLTVLSTRRSPQQPETAAGYL